jgi:hypothetical protein
MMIIDPSTAVGILLVCLGLGCMYVIYLLMWDENDS